MQNEISGNDRLLTAGEIRVLQAYLRVLGSFGDPDQVRGNQVVTGVVGPRTRDALQHYASRYPDAPEPRATLRMLEHVRRSYFQQFSPQTIAETPWQLLDALTLAAPDMPQSEVIRELHPAMRLPLVQAIRELQGLGVNVRVTSGFRSAQGQENLIREGLSNAPPGASFHAYGLAVDIQPRHGGLNPDSRDWRTIIDVMRRHGFYSLYEGQGWDVPHFELPARTTEMMRWPIDAQGWKIIPEEVLPEAWRGINSAATESFLHPHPHSSRCPEPICPPHLASVSRTPMQQRC